MNAGGCGGEEEMNWEEYLIEIERDVQRHEWTKGIKEKKEEEVKRVNVAEEENREERET